MKFWIALATMSVIIPALSANAQTYSLGSINSGPVDVTSSYKPGYKLYDFNDGTSPFTGGGIKSATLTNQYVAPAGDTTPYFSVGPSTSVSASLSLSGVNQLSFYWGSIDTYNLITFNGLGTSFSGSAFGGTNSLVTRPSREVTFYFSPSESAALTGITLSSGTNAFELDNLIFGSSAPEPATWAMMIIGFGVAGLSLRRRQKVVSTSSPMI